MTEWEEMWVRWEVWKKPEDELDLELASSKGMAGSARMSVQLSGAGVSALGAA